jgi:hypothetical protein
MSNSDGPAGVLRRFVTSPVLLVLVIAPFFGEGLSGSSPPLDLLLPWQFAFMAALYGCGALVCREVTYRCRLGFPGLVLLGAAYAVWEEALVDRYWFFPQFWHDSGVGTYSVVWHTNVLLAVHLTAFHTAISICASVLVVEWLVPRGRDRPWVGRAGLGLASAVLALTPAIYGEFDQRPPVLVLVTAALLLTALLSTALVIGRRHRGRPVLGEVNQRNPQRGLSMLAFTCVLVHWVLTYAVADVGVPWPAGVALSVSPVVIGLLLVPRLATTGPYGSDGIRVVVGLLWFFVLLDLLVALLGRYDMIISAALTAWLARRLSKKRASLGFEPGDHRAWS